MSRHNHSKGTYKPNGLPARMLAYFRANPHDTPTRAELALILDARPANISMAFKKLADEGILEARNVIQLVEKTAG